jgi:hypothetical protein
MDQRAASLHRRGKCRHLLIMKTLLSSSRRLAAVQRRGPRRHSVVVRS